MPMAVRTNIPRPGWFVFEYPMVPLKVVDGDTVDCLFDRGFGSTDALRFRLADIDAPEMRGKNASPEGPVARDFVVNWFEERGDLSLVIRTVKGHPSTVGIGDGAFGRWLGNVLDAAGDSLAEDIVQAGLAARGFMPS